MEFFTKAKAVKLRSHLDKYLAADENHENVRQSSNGSSRKARWLVELVESNSHVIRLKSCHGRYLTASNVSFLLGMTGNRVYHTVPDNSNELAIEWQPIRDGFQVKLRAFSGTYLRANGGTPPWRNSITHDGASYSPSTKNWILWDVEAVDVPENESLTDYLSMVSSISSLSDDIFGSELGSPMSIQSISTPRWSSMKTAMDLFHNATTVRLKSHHDKYLHADEDEDSVTQDRNGSSKNARWTVEYAGDGGGFESNKTIIRLKSCYGRYLTASNQPYLLGMTGRKVTQTLTRRLDSSVEWEPISEGNRVKLRTRYGQFLRANGGVPPWRNSVTHDIPHRTSTQDWVLWEVDVVEILVKPPAGKPSPTQLVPDSDSFTSDSTSPSTHSNKSTSFSRQESSDSLNSPPKAGEGRMIWYHVADEFGDVDEGIEGICIKFNGNGVEELTRKLEEETGLESIIVCSRSPLNGNLCPLRLQLPPNKAPMNVVIVQSSAKVAKGFA